MRLAAIMGATAIVLAGRYFEIDSELGHAASGPKHPKLSPVLREFLEPLIAERS